MALLQPTISERFRGLEVAERWRKRVGVEPTIAINDSDLRF